MFFLWLVETPPSKAIGTHQRAGQASDTTGAPLPTVGLASTRNQVQK